MAAKVSNGWTAAAGTTSLPAAEETRLARKYSEMYINDGEMEKEEGETNINGGEMEEEGKMDINGDKMEEEEITDFVSRFASLRRREGRLAVIAADLSRMKEQRGSSVPTFIELAAFVFLREIANASLEGLPTTLSVRSLFG